MKRLIEEFNDHKGELVITATNNIMQLVAIAKDESDYYYVLRNNISFEFQTCVGGLIFLKNQLSDNDYDYLYNGVVDSYFMKELPEGLFDEKFKEWKIEKEKQGDRFVTDFVFK